MAFIRRRRGVRLSEDTFMVRPGSPPIDRTRFRGFIVADGAHQHHFSGDGWPISALMIEDEAIPRDGDRMCAAGGILCE